MARRRTRRTSGDERQYAPNVRVSDPDCLVRTAAQDQPDRAIWLPLGDALVLAAPRINEALDNKESNECANAPVRCEERRFDIVPDTTDAGPVYPLIVTETGTRGDRAIHVRHTVKFDASRARYIVPKALRDAY